MTTVTEGCIRLSESGFGSIVKPTGATSLNKGHSIHESGTGFIISPKLVSIIEYPRRPGKTCTLITVTSQYPVARSPSCSRHPSPCLATPSQRLCVHGHTQHMGPPAYTCSAMNAHLPAAQAAWQALCLIWQWHPLQTRSAWPSVVNSIDCLVR